MKTKFILLIIFLTCHSILFGQISAYSGIIFPFDDQSYNSDITEISNPKIYPAHNGLVNAAKFVINGNVNYLYNGYSSKSYFYELDGRKETDKSETFLSTGPIQVGLVYPIKFSDKQITISLFTEQFHNPSLEYQKLAETDSTFAQSDRKDNVWNTSLGLSFKLTDFLSLGVGYTSWFGEWNYNKSFGHFGFEREFGTRYSFSGNQFNVGLNFENHKHHSSITFYAPYKLWDYESWRKTIIAYEGFPQKPNKEEQNIGWAARVKLSHLIFENGWLGLTYRYQNRAKKATNNDYENYISTNSHLISAFGKYQLKIKNHPVKIFSAFTTKLLTEGGTAFLFNNGDIIVGENEWDQKIDAGLQLKLTKVTLLSSGGFIKSKYQISGNTFPES